MIRDASWLKTAKGESRGYIQPQSLKELWFHTGTTCNLRCPFCFEGSFPGNHRLQSIRLEDAIPFMDEALNLGVEQFSFTGGEPFMVKDMVAILDYALNLKPCLVLSNATNPLWGRLKEILPLRGKPHALSFRVSLDFPDPARHDAGRGEGSFFKSLQTMGELYRQGFRVSIARQHQEGEDTHALNAAYRPYLEQAGLPGSTLIVSFPELHLPGSHPEVPEITESCMRTYKTRQQREAFMCNFSKMIVKKDDQMQVYACTLVDDDPDYAMGTSLSQAMPEKVMLRHHRCFGCFKSGTSCSEL